MDRGPAFAPEGGTAQGDRQVSAHGPTFSTQANSRRARRRTAAVLRARHNQLRPRRYDFVDDVGVALVMAFGRIAVYVEVLAFDVTEAAQLGKKCAPCASPARLGHEVRRDRRMEKCDPAPRPRRLGARCERASEPGQDEIAPSHRDPLNGPRAQAKTGWPVHPRRIPLRSSYREDRSPGFLTPSVRHVSAWPSTLAMLHLRYGGPQQQSDATSIRPDRTAAEGREA
jgi:hypothetical protein